MKRHDTSSMRNIQRVEVSMSREEVIMIDRKYFEPFVLMADLSILCFLIAAH